MRLWWCSFWVWESVSPQYKNLIKENGWCLCSLEVILWNKTFIMRTPEESLYFGSENTHLNSSPKQKTGKIFLAIKHLRRCSKKVIKIVTLRINVKNTVFNKVHSAILSITQALCVSEYTQCVYFMKNLSV